MSPTQRTLKYLRSRGDVAAITEHWNPFAKIRQDLLGFIDLLAISQRNLIGIQTTSGANHNARKNKILASPLSRLWLETGNAIEVWSWSKKKVKRGGKALQWVVKIEPITLENYD